MCDNDNTSKDCKCISEILTVINILQENAECSDACLDTCDRGFLGCSVSSVGCNTRPVMLYTCCGNGIPWSMPTTKDDIICNNENSSCSNVFRVEKVDGCCATFRVLERNKDPETSCVSPFAATNSFFTMNLNCVCSLRCLNDTHVECV